MKSLAGCVPLDATYTLLGATAGLVLGLGLFGSLFKVLADSARSTQLLAEARLQRLAATRHSTFDAVPSPLFKPYR
jgi:hypothetical protein